MRQPMAALLLMLFKLSIGIRELEFWQLGLGSSVFGFWFLYLYFIFYFIKKPSPGSEFLVLSLESYPEIYGFKNFMPESVFLVPGPV